MLNQDFFLFDVKHQLLECCGRLSVSAFGGVRCDMLLGVDKDLGQRVPSYRLKSRSVSLEEGQSRLKAGGSCWWQEDLWEEMRRVK